MTPITSPSPGEGACSAAFPPWTASGIRERLGAFLHDGSLASWAGPHVLRRAADGTPFVGGTAIRQLAAGAVLPEREVMVALLQDGIWPERFRRNYGVFSADAMVRLLQTRVFVLGCGGLGGHVASLLARLGVGGLRLCDSDIFEESNLNRQYFCTESTLGQPKAVATARGLRDMAGYLALDVRHVEADEKNLPDMLQDVDVALDCLDDLALKMLLEERSAAAGVPFVHGSVLRAEGFARAARSGRLHLRELYASGLTSEEAGSARHEGAEQQCEAQKQIIEEMEKKVSYLDLILSSTSTMTITQIAQDYGMSGQKMNKLLHKLHIQYKVSDQWILYAEYKDKCYVSSETIHFMTNEGVPCTTLNTKWTQKGRLFLYDILKKEGILPKMEWAKKAARDKNAPNETRNSNDLE